MNHQKKREALELLAFHNVPVSALMKYCNPFQCWQELERSITKKEIRDCLKNGGEALVETPLALVLSFSDDAIDAALLRTNHIKKIAYFAKNEPTQAIQVDVGLPEMGCFVSYFIEDGNHRFAGSIVAGRETIACSIAGSVENIKELGLWYPNEAYLALIALYDRSAQLSTGP